MFRKVLNWFKSRKEFKERWKEVSDFTEKMKQHLKKYLQEKFDIFDLPVLSFKFLDDDDIISAETELGTYWVRIVDFIQYLEANKVVL